MIFPNNQTEFLLHQAYNNIYTEDDKKEKKERKKF